MTSRYRTCNIKRAYNVIKVRVLCGYSRLTHSPTQTHAPIVKADPPLTNISWIPLVKPYYFGIRTEKPTRTCMENWIRAVRRYGPGNLLFHELKKTQTACGYSSRWNGLLLITEIVLWTIKNPTDNRWKSPSPGKAQFEDECERRTIRSI